MPLTNGGDRGESTGEFSEVARRIKKVRHADRCTYAHGQGWRLEARACGGQRGHAAQGGDRHVVEKKKKRKKAKNPKVYLPVSREHGGQLHDATDRQSERDSAGRDSELREARRLIGLLSRGSRCALSHSPYVKTDHVIVSWILRTEEREKSSSPRRKRPQSAPQ